MVSRTAFPFVVVVYTWFWLWNIQSTFALVRHTQFTPTTKRLALRKQVPWGTTTKTLSLHKLWKTTTTTTTMLIPVSTNPFRSSWSSSLSLPSFSSSSLSLSSSLEMQEEDIHTVTTLTSPKGQGITLIGTAHLSQRSNDQVQRLIQEIQPNVVLVELDPSRLIRIGITSLDEIRIPRIVSADDIILPNQEGTTMTPTSWIGWMIRPFWVLQEALTEAFSRMARALLTGMYKDMSDKINNPVGGGGEFLVAIRAAEQVADCTTLILGDRSSIITIKRAATLAIQSGDPLGVLQRLQEANSEEMSQLETQVRQKLQAELGAEEVDEAQVSVTMMETLKEDSQFRDRLFRKLEQQVPEFTQAFLKERDYIMAEAIRRELEFDPTIERVVGVVGLAHVAGMEETLQAMFTNETLPLLRSVKI